MSFKKLMQFFAYTSAVAFFFTLSPQVEALGGNYSWDSNGNINVSGSPFSGSGTIKDAGSGKWVLASDIKANLGQGICSYGNGASASGTLTFTVDKSKNQIDFSSFKSTNGSQSCAPGSSFLTGPSTISGNASTPTNTNPQSCDDYRAIDPTLGTACGQGMTYASQGLDAGNSACDQDPLGGAGSNGVSTTDLKAACKLGVKLGVAKSFTDQFASIKSAACAGESGGTASSCMSTFDSNLQSCIGSSGGDIQKTKDCMKTKYPDLASQIDGIGGGENGPTCQSNVPSIGWIVCPVLDAMAGVADGAWGIIQHLLEADTLSLLRGDGTQSDYFRVWQSFLNIANVILVIAFLFVIYSQLTSAGISNYGIKKMLPKLLIVAVLINASFYISAALIDIFNVAGRSLYSLLKGIYGDIGAFVTWDNVLGLLLTAGAATAAGFAGIALAGGATAAFFMVAPLMLGAIIGVVAALITLMFRQAIIPLLAVLSPIAFACLLLPNMEQWFTRWRKTFFAMLMIYPIAAVLFGGFQLAGKLIAGDGGNAFSLVMALVIMMMPMFLLPFIAAKTEGFLGQMNAKLTGAKNRLGGAVKGWADSRGGLAKARYDALPANGQRRGLRALRHGLINRSNIRKMQTGAYQAEQNAEFNRHVIDNEKSIAEGQGKVGEAYIGDIADKWRDEEVGRQQKTMTSTNTADLQKIYRDAGESDERRAAAAGMIMKNGAMKDIHQLFDDTQTMGAGSAARGMRKQMMHDMNRTPFGFSSGDMAAMKRGEAAHDLDASGNPVGNPVDYAHRLETRSQKKLSDATWGSLDPDDQIKLKEQALAGGLSRTSLQNLADVTLQAENNPNVKVTVEAQELGRKIREYASVQGITATGAQAPAKPSLGPVGSEVINNPPAADGTLDVHGRG